MSQHFEARVSSAGSVAAGVMPLWPGAHVLCAAFAIFVCALGCTTPDSDAGVDPWWTARPTANEPQRQQVPPALRAAFIAAQQADAGPEYEFTSDAGGVTGRVPSQGFQVVMALDGAATLRSSGPAVEGESWSLELRLADVHRGSHARRVPEAVALPELDRSTGVATRVRQQYSGGLEMWYASGPLGLEQGFTIRERPEGDGELVVSVDAHGLSPVLHSDQLSFDGAGRSRLRYTDLFVRDAMGRDLPARFGVEGTLVRIVVDDVNAAYPIEIDPLLWFEHQELVGDAGLLENFGLAASVSSDFAAIGAPAATVNGNAAQGAVYVFSQIGGVWSLDAKLTAPDGEAADYFGAAVALSGNTVVVGRCRVTFPVRPGAAYAFVRNNGIWSWQKTFTMPGGLAGDWFGSAVALDADTVAIGGPRETIGANSMQGSVHVFVRTGNSWGPDTRITATDGNPTDQFGRSVSLSSDTLLVGAPSKEPAGGAYVYVRSGGTWTEQASLSALDAQANDSFGYSVGVSGDFAIIGLPTRTVGGNPFVGVAYTFTRNGTAWIQKAELSPSGLPASSYFGSAVAISGSTSIVGAGGDNEGGNVSQGAVYVYVGNALAQRLTSSDGMAHDGFGASLSISGDTILVGATGHAVGNGSGAAYVSLYRKSLADPCALATECESGFCVDGVCCDNACDLPCLACTTAGKGSGADGVCGFIAANTDPYDECGVGSESSCNGNGACWANTVQPCSLNAQCASGFCADGVCCSSACDQTCEACIDAKTGNGQDGTCGFVVAHTDPDTECVGSLLNCDGQGSCRFELGGPCSAGIDCQTGICVDGVCCDTPCDGSCEACSVQMNGSAPNGTCGPIVAGEDPDGDCAPDASNACGADGTCDGAGQCRVLAPEGAACGGAACGGDGVVTVGGTCDGAGTCDHDTLPCAPYRCTPGGACLASCTAGSDCVGGTVCSVDGKCVAPGSPNTGDESGCACRTTIGGASGRDTLGGFLAILSLWAFAGARRTRRRLFT